MELNESLNIPKISENDIRSLSMSINHWDRLGSCQVLDLSRDKEEKTGLQTLSIDVCRLSEQHVTGLSGPLDILNPWVLLL